MKFPEFQWSQTTCYQLPPELEPIPDSPLIPKQPKRPRPTGSSSTPAQVQSTSVSEPHEPPSKRQVTVHKLKQLLGGQLLKIIEPGLDFVLFNDKALKDDLETLTTSSESNISKSDLEVLNSDVFIRFLAWQRLQQLKRRSKSIQSPKLPENNSGEIITSSSSCSSPDMINFSEIIPKLDPESLYKPLRSWSAQTEDLNTIHPYFNYMCPTICGEDLNEKVEIPNPSDPTSYYARLHGDGISVFMVTPTLEIGRHKPNVNLLDSTPLDSSLRFDISQEVIDKMKESKAGVNLAKISHRHLRIFLNPEDQKFWLINYSFNGTKLDQELIRDEPRVLSNGCIIRLGGINLMFTINRQYY